MPSFVLPRIAGFMMQYLEARYLYGILFLFDLVMKNSQQKRSSGTGKIRVGMVPYSNTMHEHTLNKADALGVRV